MSLSNTAVPKYYAVWRDRVYRGEIPVSQTIQMEMNRIDALIADPRYYFDNDKVEGWIKFCENELVLVDGRPLRLMDSFKLWGEELFGWYEMVLKQIPIEDEYGNIHYETYLVPQQLVLKQYLIVGRGAAKTMYAMCIQFIHL